MHIRLDSHDDLPLFAQLARQLREAIAGGQWSREQPLPSVRTLVSLLKVNPQTVLRALGELESEGLIERRQGQGTFVVPGAVERAARQRQLEVVAELHRLARLARVLGATEHEIVAAISADDGGSDNAT